MDKAGDATVVVGVRGGGGGGDEATTWPAFVFGPELAISRGWVLALSSANASQKALCVIKLSLLIRSKTKQMEVSKRRLRERERKKKGKFFSWTKRGKRMKRIGNLENMVPQSHLYSLVPQVFMCAFQSDWTAYFFEHLSHFHFFSPCFLQKCFFMPVRSPRALPGLWWTQEGSGHT